MSTTAAPGGGGGGAGGGISVAELKNMTRLRMSTGQGWQSGGRGRHHSPPPPSQQHSPRLSPPPGLHVHPQQQKPQMAASGHAGNMSPITTGGEGAGVVAAAAEANRAGSSEAAPSQPPPAAAAGGETRVSTAAPRPMPHGLTVGELKELTKLRLAKEGVKHFGQGGSGDSRASSRANSRSPSPAGLRMPQRSVRVRSASPRPRGGDRMGRHGGVSTSPVRPPLVSLKRSGNNSNNNNNGNGNSSGSAAGGCGGGDVGSEGCCHEPQQEQLEPSAYPVRGSTSNGQIMPDVAEFVPQSFASSPLAPPSFSEQQQPQQQHRRGRQQEQQGAGSGTPSQLSRNGFGADPAVALAFRAGHTPEEKKRRQLLSRTLSTYTPADLKRCASIQSLASDIEEDISYKVAEYVLLTPKGKTPGCHSRTGSSTMASFLKEQGGGGGGGGGIAALLAMGGGGDREVDTTEALRRSWSRTIKKKKNAGGGGGGGGGGEGGEGEGGQWSIDSLLLGIGPPSGLGEGEAQGSEETEPYGYPVERSNLFFELDCGSGDLEENEEGTRSMSGLSGATSVEDGSGGSSDDKGMACAFFRDNTDAEVHVDGEAASTGQRSETSSSSGGGGWSDTNHSLHRRHHRALFTGGGEGEGGGGGGEGGGAREGTIVEGGVFLSPAAQRLRSVANLYNKGCLSEEQRAAAKKDIILSSTSSSSSLSSSISSAASSSSVSSFSAAAGEGAGGMWHTPVVW